MAETVAGLQMVKGVAMVSVDASLCDDTSSLASVLSTCLSALQDGGTLLLVSCSLLVPGHCEDRIQCLAIAAACFKNVQMVKPTASLAGASSVDVVMTSFSRLHYDTEVCGREAWKSLATAPSEVVREITAGTEYFGCLQYAAMQCSLLEIAERQRRTADDVRIEDTPKTVEDSETGVTEDTVATKELAASRFLSERVEDYVGRFAVRPLAGSEFYVLPRK